MFTCKLPSLWVSCRGRRPWRVRRVCHSWLCHSEGAWAGADHRGSWSSDLPDLSGICSHHLAPRGSGHRSHSGPQNTNSSWECWESLESHLSVSLHQLLSNVTLRRCHLSTNAHDNNLGTGSKLCIKSLKTVSGYSWYCSDSRTIAGLTLITVRRTPSLRAHWAPTLNLSNSLCLSLSGLRGSLLLHRIDQRLTAPTSEAPPGSSARQIRAQNSWPHYALSPISRPSAQEIVRCLLPVPKKRKIH